MTLRYVGLWDPRTLGLLDLFPPSTHPHTLSYSPPLLWFDMGGVDIGDWDWHLAYLCHCDAQDNHLTVLIFPNVQPTGIIDPLVLAVDQRWRLFFELSFTNIEKVQADCVLTFLLMLGNTHIIVFLFQHLFHKEKRYQTQCSHWILLLIFSLAASHCYIMFPSSKVFLISYFFSELRCFVIEEHHRH